MRVSQSEFLLAELRHVHCMRGASHRLASKEWLLRSLVVQTPSGISPNKRMLGLDITCDCKCLLTVSMTGPLAVRDANSDVCLALWLSSIVVDRLVMPVFVGYKVRAYGDSHLRIAESFKVKLATE